MKPCWKMAGLTEEGAAMADRYLLAMVIMFNNGVTQEVAEVVMREAAYQAFELPKRTAKYRNRYLKENRG